MAAADYTSLVQSLYVSYFGRPADSFGLANFAAQLDAMKAPTTSVGLAAAYQSNAGLKSLIDSFGTSQESKDLYGTDDLAFVTSIYRNAFNREPDFDGLMFWTTAIRSGNLSKANAALTIVAESVNNTSAQGKADAALIANKVTVAANFTAAIDTGAELAAYNGNAAAATARAMLSAVTATTLAVDFQANVDATLATLVANANPGVTSSLTIGQDTLVGTAGNDVFNAFSFNSVSGADAKTLNSFDSIDGGAGRDTLNIQLKATTGNTLAELGTIKNVEIINITEDVATNIDASKFVGATTINQIGKAGDVTNLANGATAGFDGIAGHDLVVTAAGASAAVSMNNVDEASAVNVSGDNLASVTVSGTRADTNSDGAVPALILNVEAGKDVQSVAIKSAIDATLVLTENAGTAATKHVAAVDASASTGAIEFDATGDTALATIKTGAGKDKVTINTLTAAATTTVAAINATVATGAGNDTIIVNTTGTGLTSVDGGAGNDIITLNKVAGAGLNVNGGDGNDTITINGVLATTDIVTGGAGNDTVVVAGKSARLADDYIVFNKLITGFETIKFATTAETALDASQLAAGYTTIDLFTGSAVTGVGSQSVVANGALTATATGYSVSGTTVTYGGTLNITEKAAGTVTANADVVKLSVTGLAASLTGDMQTATITVNNKLNATGDADVLGSVSVNTAATGAMSALKSLTLVGSGAATVVNAGGKLVTVDASALGGTLVDGKATAGLTYQSTNTAAETVKLGSGVDKITVGASTYGKVDTITGLNLAFNADKSGLDTSSDQLNITGITSATTVAKFTSTQTDIDFLLKDVVAGKTVAGTTVVFQLGTDTYVFQDNGTAGSVDAADVLVKLTGTQDLDLVIKALGTAIV
jgi:hypothetical protein